MKDLDFSEDELYELTNLVDMELLFVKKYLYSSSEFYESKIKVLNAISSKLSDYIVSLLEGKQGKWYQNESYGGYFNDEGYLEVVVEFGTDADFDTHAVDIQNGDGYYDEFGKYRSFGKD